jgi:RNA polymerase sigma factor (sigma-70 family)
VRAGEERASRVAPEPGPDAFEGLEPHYAPLRRFAYLITGDVGIAADLAHEAVERSVRAGLDLTAPKAMPYLRTTVVNLWRRTLRRRALEARALMRIGRGSSLVDDDGADDRDQVWRALRRVRYDARVCLVLRYYEDLSLAQIADELGLPLGTVKSRLSRGLKELARHLGERDA